MKHPPKGTTMKTGQKFGAIVALLLLAACGGGGGDSGGGTQPPTGGSNPPPQTSVTGTITSVTDTSIALGAANGESTIVWTSTATTADQISVRVNGVKISGQSASSAGGQKVAVGAGDVKVELVDSAGKVLDTKTAKATCAMGHWQNGICDKFRFDRLDVAILQTTVEQFWALKDGQAIPFQNKTGYDSKPGAVIPLGNCVLYDLLREDGAPLFSCTTIETGNQRRTFPVNPLTLEILPEYTGSLPSGVVMIDAGYGGGVATPYTKYNIVDKSQYAEVPGFGIYYFDGYDSTRLRLTRDLFQTYTVVKEVADYRLIYSYLGPK